MLKLKLEEIANPSQTSFIAPVYGSEYVVVKAATSEGIAKARPTAIQGVYHYQLFGMEYLLIDCNMPDNQGFFSLFADRPRYTNNSDYGTLVIPVGSSDKIRVREEYDAAIGDVFFIGFPDSEPRLKATIVDI